MILLAIAREPLEWRERVDTYTEILLDTDLDGRATFSPPRGVPWKSVWVAVDPLDGSATVATGPGFPRRALEFDPAIGLKREGRGGLKKLLRQTDRLAILIVRPGGGAWRMTTSDGGSGDDDGDDDGRVSVDLSRAEPLGTVFGRLQQLLPGDVIVGIEPKGLGFFVYQLEGGGR